MALKTICRKLIALALILGAFDFITGDTTSSPVGDFGRGSHHENMRKMQAFKASLIRGAPSSAPWMPRNEVGT